MSVHVDEMSSDIQVEPEPTPHGTSQTEMPWNERERVRAIMDRLRRDALRTESRGFDD